MKPGAVKQSGLGGVQYDLPLPGDDTIDANLIDDLPEITKRFLDVEGPLGSTARSVRLRALIASRQYALVLQASAITESDYAIWLKYFPEKNEYEAHGNIERLHMGEALGLKDGTIPTVELYFGRTVFFFLRRRNMLDAAVVGVPDDRSLSRICLARIFRYGIEYQRVPTIANDMQKVIAARRSPFLERRRFRRQDPHGMFA